MKPIHKRIAVALAGLSLSSLLAVSAQATPATVVETGDGSGTFVDIQTSQTATLGPVTPVFAGILDLTVNGVATEGFCIDPWDFTGDSTSYNSTTLTGDTKVGMTAADATVIEQLMTEYYTPSLTNNTTAAELQVAIWETVATNNTHDSAPVDYQFSLVANELSDNAIGAGATAMLNFVETPANNVAPDLNITALTSTGNQDVLIPGGQVPDGGATLGLFGLAIVALAGFRRKFQTC